jgi:hypothetical protein
LRARSPGEYALLSLEAGNKFVTKLEGVGGAPIH